MGVMLIGCGSLRQSANSYLIASSLGDNKVSNPYVVLRSLSTVVRLTAFAMMASVFAFTGCSSPKPAEYLVGEWKANDSAAANAIRAAKLKNENPGASSDMARDAGRAMGNMAAKFAKDQTFELVWQGQTEKGTWTYDEARKEVHLKLDAPTVDPNHPDLEKAKEAAAQPRTWVAELDVGQSRLELYMLDPAGVDRLKAVQKTDPKIKPMTFKLKKQ